MFKKFTSSTSSNSSNSSKQENKELNLDNRDQIIKNFRELLGKDNERYDDDVSLLNSTLLHF